MDFNTFLIRFGLNYEDFDPKPIDPIPFEGGLIYETSQKRTGHACPLCGNMELKIKDYHTVEVASHQTKDLKEIFRIKKVRLYCPCCGKSFTPELHGIARKQTITSITRQHMISDFCSCKTFKEIGEVYGLTTNRIIQIFDESFPAVPRRPLPEILCIDEIYFKGDTETKYIVILSDFVNGDVIDVIKERQMPYLREYFDGINQHEREKVKVLISDMYDGYYTIGNQYLPNSMHCIDLFHVVKQLAQVVNRQRNRAVNKLDKDKKIYKNFMKSHWKLFLCHKKDIPDKFYTPKGQSKRYHYDEMILECCKCDLTLWDGYALLQELMTYDVYKDHTSALKFVERIISKLEATGDELYLKVAKTYHRWRYEIANAFTKNQYHKRFTNAKAENNNTHIKRIVKSGYGYRNFERFRKKILLNRTYKK